MQYPQTTVVLTDDERRRRVAELLCKAIVLADAKRIVALVCITEEPPALSHFSVMPDDSRSEETRIRDYLEFTGKGSPVSIRQALGLSRSATYRALHRLTVAGHVVPVGQTRMLAYQLNKAEPPPPDIALN